MERSGKPSLILEPYQSFALDVLKKRNVGFKKL